MKRRVLGKTNLWVSEVGCGGIPVQRVTQADVNKLVDALIEEDINFIDSARGYTDSETKFGIAMQGKREKFILATKSMSRGYDNMKKDIEISLNNFQTDYIDLYQIHNLKSSDNYEGALRALREAKEKGKIKHIGVTCHSLDFINRLLDNDDWMDTIQCPYNFLEPQANDVFKKAREKNIGVIVMKPLAGGNIDNPIISIKYILSNDDVSVCIPGMENEEQVKENASVKDYHLNDDDKLYINKTIKEIGRNFCHRCGYCLPCSVGIDIPSCFMFENYYLRYNLKDWAKNRYSSLKVKAASCIKCHKCEERCPYNLEIVKKLEKVSKLFMGDKDDER